MLWDWEGLISPSLNTVEASDIKNNHDNSPQTATRERSSGVRPFKLFRSLLCLVIKTNAETGVVSEDALPGEMCGPRVKGIKLENKSHLEERNELPSTKGRRKVDFASS